MEFVANDGVSCLFLFSVLWLEGIIGQNHKDRMSAFNHIFLSQTLKRFGEKL